MDNFDNIDYKIIGERLKQARLDNHLTQDALSEKIDVSIAYLSRVERGTSCINLKRLNQLCQVLNVPIGYILNGVSSKSENYLDEDFSQLLKGCSPEGQRLIYDMAKVVYDHEQEKKNDDQYRY